MEKSPISESEYNKINIEEVISIFKANNFDAFMFYVSSIFQV